MHQKGACQLIQRDVSTYVEKGYRLQASAGWLSAALFFPEKLGRIVLPRWETARLSKDVRPAYAREKQSPEYSRQTRKAAQNTIVRSRFLVDKRHYWSERAPNMTQTDTPADDTPAATITAEDAAETKPLGAASPIPQGLQAALKGVGGIRMARWAGLLPQVETHEARYAQMSDHELRKESLSLRYRIKSGETSASVLPEAYALVRLTAQRVLNMRHFDVQILGGIAIFHGSIAEMQTGEGKTLTATLPMYLHALAGKGAHLATVNDYLAARDAEIMAPVYENLGMSVGVIQTQMSQPDRRTAYACDITYGTAKEFGFDFLRDRLLIRRINQVNSDIFGGGSRGGSGGEKPVQREAYFCLVDEADSVLIDEARTPLIISALPGDDEQIAVACYGWAHKVQGEFVEDEDYEYDYEKKKVELLMQGRQKVRSLQHPEGIRDVGLIDLYEYIERAIKVKRDFHLDREYVVREGEIVIVDESTGRLAEGRKWRDGIHQAIEAQEGVEVTVATGQAARITVQDLFLRYKFLAGMTGTASTSAKELKKIYKTAVVKIPTNRPTRRANWPDRVFGVAQEKWEAVVEDIVKLHAEGRPMLVGTRSIKKSELLSQMLAAKGVPHKVLNARRVAEEAEIVAQAGQMGKVTVATNMAGRGTDIKLGEGVPELGGLHVICTELHDSARIDRQLVGRCSRQGDLGSFQFYLSLDDDILKEGLGDEKAKRLTSAGEAGGVRSSSIFRKSQKRVESKQFRDRRILLYHEKQRKKLQREMGQDPFLDSPD